MLRGVSWWSVTDVFGQPVGSDTSVNSSLRFITSHKSENFFTTRLRPENAHEPELNPIVSISFSIPDDFMIKSLSNNVLCGSEAHQSRQRTACRHALWRNDSTVMPHACSHSGIYMILRYFMLNGSPVIGARRIRGGDGGYMRISSHG
jgi:hypothetical protein